MSTGSHWAITVLVGKVGAPSQVTPHTGTRAVSPLGLQVRKNLCHSIALTPSSGMLHEAYGLQRTTLQWTIERATQLAARLNDTYLILW